MRFFKFIIAALAAGVVSGGCATENSPTSSEADSMFFQQLSLPSYNYVNAEVPLFRCILKARGKKVPLELFAWEISIQQLTLTDFKLYVYKDANFTTPAYANPIAVNAKMIPDGKPDYYYGNYPIYVIDLPVDLAGAKEFILPADTFIYFELRALMEVRGSQPGLGIYLEGIYLTSKPAAKKPTGSEWNNWNLKNQF